MGRAYGACARSDKERRRGVATLRRGGETQDQPHNRHVPTTMNDMTIQVEGLRWHAAHDTPSTAFLKLVQKERMFEVDHRVRDRVVAAAW